MEELKKLENGVNFSHVSVASINEFAGKQFVKDATGATSCEISFGSLAPGEAVPFFHTHKQNEENYIILSGEGQFQVDDEVFEIASGSIVKVSPNGVRSIKCTSAEPLVYVCIQAKAGSLEQCTMGDGVIVEHEAKW